MYFLIFILGLCCGSFINMLIYRTAVRYKLRKPKFLISNDKRSFCDFCGRQLKWYENIPVFSWVIQKGKTRCCEKKLPLTYPIVELLMGILFVIGYQISDIRSQISILILFIIIVFLVFSAVFDLKYMILPDFSTWILVGCGVILIGTRHGVFVQNLITALIASGFLLVLYFITKGKGMGMGDVKLALFMGLFLGFPKIVVAFYVAFITGALVGIILLVFFKFKRRSPIPFGPFLILGTLITYFINFQISIFNFQ